MESRSVDRQIVGRPRFCAEHSARSKRQRIARTLYLTLAPVLFRSTDYLAKWAAMSAGRKRSTVWSATSSTVVGVATGMFMLHDQVLHPRGTEAEASMPEYQR